MEEALVTEVLVPADVRPSFVIPVLQSAPQANTRYIQLVDHRGHLASLEPCAPPTSRLRTVEAPYVRVTVGSAPVHAVLTPDDRIVVGMQADVASAIAPWVKDVPHPLTRLALADFAGETAVARNAAETAHEQLMRREGSAVAQRWYLDAVLAPRAIRAMLRNAGPLADPMAVERLIERTVLTIDGDTLRIELPSELKTEHGLQFDPQEAPLQAVLSLGGPLNINRLALETRIAKPAPRPRSREAEEPGANKACAILILGDGRLFRRLAMDAAAQDSKLKNQDSLTTAIRADGLLAGHIKHTAKLPQALDAILAGRRYISTILVVHDSDTKLDKESDAADAVVKALAQWREQSPQRSEIHVDVALAYNEVRRRYRNQELVLAQSGAVRAVLSLANAWTPRWWAPVLSSRIETLSDCLEGWAAAQNCGLLDSRADGEAAGDAPILTAARLLGRGDQSVERAVVAVANPLWPDTKGAELVLGVAAEDLSKLLSIKADHFDPFMSGIRRYAKVSAAGNFVVDANGQQQRPMLALAIINPGLTQDEGAGFETYVEDRLREVGWGVHSPFGSPQSDLTIRRSGLPEVVLEVKLRATDAWQRPSRGRSEPWRGVVVGESGAALAPGRPVQAMGFDRLGELASLIGEDLKHSGPWVNLEHLEGGLLVGAEVFTGARLANHATITPREAQEWLSNGDDSTDTPMTPILSGRDIVRFPEGRCFVDDLETSALMAVRLEEYLRSQRPSFVRPVYRAPRLPTRIQQLEERPSYLLTAADTRHRIFIRAQGRIIPTGGVLVIPDEPPWLLGLLSSSVHRIWSEAVGLQRSGAVRYTTRTATSFPPPPTFMHGGESSKMALELAYLGDELSDRRAQWQYEDLLGDRRGVLTPDFLRQLAWQVPDDVRDDLSRTRTLARLYDDPPSWLLDLQANIDSLVYDAYDLPFDADRRTVVARLLALSQGNHEGTPPRIIAPPA